jgi:outer membrane protein OmpA-like peptidoglycan-associated protein
MRILFTCLPMLVLFGSCSAPPKPPAVDESQKRPANTAAAIALQVCQSELHNTRISAHESQRAVETAKAETFRLASQQRLLTAHALRVGGNRNTVHTVLFPFGDTRLVLRQPDATRLVEEARTSAWIVLRGRTDGVADSAAESRVARERSEAVRAYLVEAGVDPGRIRATWQPVGDHVADNAMPAGRRLNRRVEIELYPAAPSVAAASPDM